MADFNCRVELHDARSWSDYERLHRAMEAKGFQRTVRAGNSNYHLPPAEYLYFNGVNANQVMELAKAATSSTGHDFGVMVVEINLNNGQVYGLKPAA